ncbi:Protein of unknown function [Gryllus bimaculatus]|nr:Protein of unknown function [Gryllus bimaculatus]
MKRAVLYKFTQSLNRTDISPLGSEYDSTETPYFRVRYDGEGRCDCRHPGSNRRCTCSHGYPGVKSEWGRFAAGAGLTQLLCGRLALASAHLPLAVVWMLRCVDRCVAYASWWPLEHAAWEAVRFERKLTGHVGRGIPNVLPAGGAASRRRSGHLLGVDAGVLCRPRTHRAAKALRHTATSPPPLALNGIGKICFIQFGHWQYFDT